MRLIAILNTISGVLFGAASFFFWMSNNYLISVLMGAIAFHEIVQAVFHYRKGKQ